MNMASSSRCMVGSGGPRAMRTAFRGSRMSSVVVRASTTIADRKKKVPKFPFVKIQGQEEMKLALILNVVDPNIGGVLVMGDRGTGKSVAINVVEGDSFNSDPDDPKSMGPDCLLRWKNGETLVSVKAPTPLVELPLGATEDRICGTIDIEKALSEGIKAYEPGLLAKANRGILYVDEVNLLDDGLVDVVLDSAASGLNTVEREGVSIVHPAKFIMIGSGNPSEGELRPQLLDRFGMSVNVGTMVDKEPRIQMVLDRLAYDKDPDAFCASAQPEQDALKEKAMKARDALRKVKISMELQLLVSDICSRLNVDGLRGDLVVNRAAKALVAFEGRNTVTKEDIGRIAPLCLTHRLRKDPLDPIDTGFKVKLMFMRLTDPEFQKREAAALKKVEEAAKAPKKGGAWGGLP
eukprot:gene15199-21274_t